MKKLIFILGLLIGSFGLASNAFAFTISGTNADTSRVITTSGSELCGMIGSCYPNLTGSRLIFDAYYGEDGSYSQIFSPSGYVNFQENDDPIILNVNGTDLGNVTIKMLDIAWCHDDACLSMETSARLYDFRPNGQKIVSLSMTNAEQAQAMTGGIFATFWDIFYQNANYVFGFIGCLALIFMTYRKINEYFGD